MANKVYTNPESAVTFKDSGGAGLRLTLNNLAAGQGRISDRYDKGAGARASRYKWRATLQFAAAPSPGEAVHLCLSTSDGSDPDGQVGAADAPLTDAKRVNLLDLGVVLADVTAADTKITASGVVEILDRYFSVGVWNATGRNLRAMNDASYITLTPLPEEIQ
jgi:hypothetical protein